MYRSEPGRQTPADRVEVGDFAARDFVGDLLVLHAALQGMATGGFEEEVAVERCGLALEKVELGAVDSGCGNAREARRTEARIPLDRERPVAEEDPVRGEVGDDGGVGGVEAEATAQVEVVARDPVRVGRSS